MQYLFKRRFGAVLTVAILLVQFCLLSVPAMAEEADDLLDDDMFDDDFEDEDKE